MEGLEGMIGNLLNNPDEMKKVMEMASSFMSSSGSGIQESAPPPPDESGPSGLGDLLKDVSSLPPEIGAAAMNLMKGFGKKGNDKHALLTAMKPYLSESRRNKLDKAVSLSRVFGVGLELFGKNGGLLK